MPHPRGLDSVQKLPCCSTNRGSAVEQSGRLRKSGRRVGGLEHERAPGRTEGSGSRTRPPARLGGRRRVDGGWSRGAEDRTGTGGAHGSPAASRETGVTGSGRGVLAAPVRLCAASKRGRGTSQVPDVSERFRSLGSVG